MKTEKTTKAKTTKAAAKNIITAPARQPEAPVAATKPAAVPTAVPRSELTSDVIAARAYTIWEQKGRPQGSDLENWLLAESQLKQEIQSFTA
jgi:hypothetical protein